MYKHKLQISASFFVLKLCVLLLRAIGLVETLPYTGLLRPALYANSISNLYKVGQQIVKVSSVFCKSARELASFHAYYIHIMW